MPRVHAQHWSNDALDQTRRIDIRERQYDPSRAARKAERKPDGRDEFKCGRCKAFIGPTVSGGRHRNHCPLCLFSRHVDRSFPGDRLSDCRSMMEPIGVFHRPDGEQMLVHRCRGCGADRHNRVAADDNPLAAMRLPPIAPRRGSHARAETSVEERAS